MVTSDLSSTLDTLYKIESQCNDDWCCHSGAKSNLLTRVLLHCIEFKPERFSNFQKTSSEKKFETCGLRNLGKLIIVACWIPLKRRQLLTEARLTKTPSVSSRPRQIAKISLFLDKLTTTTTICFAVGFVLWTPPKMFCAYTEFRKLSLYISFVLRLAVLFTSIIKMIASLFSNNLDSWFKLLISFSVFCHLPVPYIYSPLQPRPKNWCWKFWPTFDPRLIFRLFIATSKFSTNPCKRGQIQIFCQPIQRRGQESYRSLKLSALTKSAKLYLTPSILEGRCEDMMITIWQIYGKLSFASFFDKCL